MKRWATCLTIAAILAVLLGTAWGVFGGKIRTALLLRRCAGAWQDLSDYRGDFEVSIDLGALSVTEQGTMWYRQPDCYRLDLDSKALRQPHVMTDGDALWLHVPPRNVAYEVTLPEEIAPADVMVNHSVKPWLDQVTKGSGIELIGNEAVAGRKCAVVEITPTSEGKDAGAQAALPALGARFRGTPFLDDWKRTRVYVDKRTSLPVRAEALKGNGNVLFTWTATDTQVNGGLPEDEFRPPEGAKIRKRKYDPGRPETLFLPPEKKDSWLDKMGDVLEEGLEEWGESELREMLDVPSEWDRSGDLDEDRVKDEVFKGLMDKL